MIKFPGLIDPHVHVREPGAIYKEDWDSCTSAALAGGFTIILAMPNTKPPVTDQASLDLSLEAAGSKARCDYGQFLGAGPDNADQAAALAPKAAALKMYLDQTYGPLCMDEMEKWEPHFAAWPHKTPICIHAEGRTLAAAILWASLYDCPVHLCHVSLRDEILLIRKAKEKGLKVTCEVTPHHLFMNNSDIARLGFGRSEVRPRLNTPADQKALWDNLDVIDCFATDHAPHTIAEKDSETPPPGFPGLETALPLLLTAVAEKRLTMESIIQRCYENPRRIFQLPEQHETWVEIDPDVRWILSVENMRSRSHWTPFENWPVQGRVERVVLRGKEVYISGQVLAQPGFGKNIRIS